MGILLATRERPAAELPATQVPPGQGVGQFAEVLGPVRVHNHAPSPVPGSIVVGLQFSDLIVPRPEIAWEELRKETLPKHLPLPPVKEFPGSFS
jgi:hypothetical protein